VAGTGVAVTGASVALGLAVVAGRVNPCCTAQVVGS